MNTNWSGGAAPAIGDDVVINATGNNFTTVDNIASLSLNSLALTYTVGGTLTVSSPLVVTGTMTVSNAPGTVSSVSIGNGTGTPALNATVMSLSQSLFTLTERVTLTGRNAASTSDGSYTFLSLAGGSGTLAMTNNSAVGTGVTLAAGDRNRADGTAVNFTLVRGNVSNSGGVVTIVQRTPTGAGGSVITGTITGNFSMTQGAANRGSTLILEAPVSASGTNSSRLVVGGNFTASGASLATGSGTSTAVPAGEVFIGSLATVEGTAGLGNGGPAGYLQLNGANNSIGLGVNIYAPIRVGNGTNAATLELLADQTHVFSPLTVNANATLDLNGHALHMTGTLGSAQNLTLLPGSTLVISATSSAGFNAVTGVGAMAYSGTLKIEMESFTLAPGDYDLFDFSSFSGDFASLDFSASPGYSGTFDASTGVLSLVPEPSIFTLGLTAAMVVTLGSRRRRQGVPRLSQSMERR